MEYRFISSDSLDEFANLLNASGELHAPVRNEDGVVRFSQVTHGSRIDLSALRTRFPPRKYLLPPQEIILTYTDESGYQLPPRQHAPVILLGLHPCDLAGIDYLDRVFLGNDPDPLYAARRKSMTLAGLSCVPDRHCSCQSSASPFKASCDLYLNHGDGGFAVESNTSRGTELLEVLQPLLEKREIEIGNDTRSNFGVSGKLSTSEIPDAGHPVWRELAERCLGCGACSACCPTCSCFDVQEYWGVTGNSGARLRRWDNCLLASHAEVAGGMNFRKERAQRFHYRYLHKTCGTGPLRGMQSCVGCGRCRVICPAGLDLSMVDRWPEGSNT